jgi:hypothetical protein
VRAYAWLDVLAARILGVARVIPSLRWVEIDYRGALIVIDTDGADKIKALVKVKHKRTAPKIGPKLDEELIGEIAVSGAEGETVFQHWTSFCAWLDAMPSREDRRRTSMILDQSVELAMRHGKQEKDRDTFSKALKRQIHEALRKHL